MAALLWLCCCGYIAVATLLWLHCYGYVVNRGHHAATEHPYPVTTHSMPLPWHAMACMLVVGNPE